MVDFFTGGCSSASEEMDEAAEDDESLLALRFRRGDSGSGGVLGPVGRRTCGFSKAPKLEPAMGCGGGCSSSGGGGGGGVDEPRRSFLVGDLVDPLPALSSSLLLLLYCRFRRTRSRLEDEEESSVKRKNF